MAFDDILQKITADGAEAVAAVKADADDTVARIQRNADAEATALREQLHNQALRRTKEQVDRLLTLAQLEQRKTVLAEKQRALRDAFTQAEARVAALPAPEAKALLRHVILEHAETGAEEIVPGRAHAPVIDQAFVAELNGELGDRGRLTVATEPGDFEHGVVLREGRKEINLRLPVLMAEARERLMHRIATQLFPTDAD